MSTLIVVGTVQSRVKQATSRLSSRLNSVDNKLVERLMINEERRNIISFHDNSWIIAFPLTSAPSGVDLKVHGNLCLILFNIKHPGGSQRQRYRFRTAAGCYV